jgi:hypothetical protein
MQGESGLSGRGIADQKEHAALVDAAGGVYPDVVGERCESPSVHTLEERNQGHFDGSSGEGYGSVLAHDIVLAIARDIEVSVVGDDVVLVGVLHDIAKPVREFRELGADLHRASQELKPFHADQMIRPSLTKSSGRSRPSQRISGILSQINATADILNNESK